MRNYCCLIRQSVEACFDGNGKRVKKAEGGANTYYVYSSVIGSAVMEVNSSSVQRAYVMNGGAVVAQRNPDGNFYWLHADHLGSGRKMTNTSGNLTYRAEFDPYGKLLYEWSATPNQNTKKFTGYERDAGSGLDYAQARMYGSEWGRFMSPDPAGLASANAYSPMSLNRYSYVGGDPVNRVDPSGLLTLLVHGTGSDPNEHEWANYGSEFWQNVSTTFGEEATPFDWREYSSTLQVSFLEGYYGILAGGLKLANFLNKYPFKEGEKLNIVAHSHGGNIVKVASLLINHEIDNLVTLGTPQNSDLGVIINGHKAAKNHCNVSSLVDYKQFYGSSPTQVAATGYYTGLGFANGYASTHYWWMSIFEPDPYLKAYYQGQSVYHAQLSALYFADAAAWYMSTRINPVANRNVILGYESHHDLITAETWKDNVRSGCGF